MTLTIQDALGMLKSYKHAVVPNCIEAKETEAALLHNFLIAALEDYDRVKKDAECRRLKYLYDKQMKALVTPAFSFAQWLIYIDKDIDAQIAKEKS